MRYNRKNRLRVNNKSPIKRGLVITAFILVFAALIAYGVVAYSRTGTIIPTAELFDGRPTIRFVDVGQGDCTLVTYRGDSVLIDAGPRSNGEIAADYVRMYAPTIDYMVITHPHEDHIGGAVDIMKRTKVKNLVLPDIEVGEEFYRNTIALAEKRGVNIIRLNEEQSFDTDGGAIHIDVLDAFGLEYDDLNDASLITKVKVGSTAVLFTGDAEHEEEAVLLWRVPDQLDCDILQVGHHGSSTSTDEDFLAACSPEKCVISCGKNNSYGHPSAEVLQRIKDFGAEVFRTDRKGTVVLRGQK